MNRLENIVKNIYYGFGGKILTILLTFISRTFFIHILGSSYLGINGLFTDILSVLSMADLGLSTAMIYSFYEPISKKDYNKVSALTSFYKKIYLIIFIVILSCGIFLIPFLKYIINMPQSIDHIYIYYLIFLFNTASSYLFVYKTSIISASQKEYIISNYNTIGRLIIMILQIIILLCFKSYILFLLVQVFGTLIINILLSIKAEKMYPEIMMQNTLTITEKKSIFLNIKNAFIYRISSVLINSTDNILISILIGTVYVGWYSNYLLVINGFNGFISIVFTSMTASVGNILAIESEKKAIEAFKKIQTISLLIGTFTTLVFILLINNFIVVWLGKKYIFDFLTVIAIGINFYLANMLQPIWVYRQAAGLYKETKYIMVYCAIINLILSIILGKIIGIAGIFFASAIARLSTYVWFEPQILFKKYLHSNALIYFKRVLLNCIVTFGSIIMFNYMFHGISMDLKGLFIKGGIICIYIVLIFLFYLKVLKKFMISRKK